MAERASICSEHASCTPHDPETTARQTRENRNSAAVDKPTRTRPRKRTARVNATEPPAARLATVEQQPALQMSAAQLRSEMGAATQTASSMMFRAIIEPLEEMRTATAKMEGMVSKARDQVEQRQRLWTAVIGMVMGGVMLWVGLAAVLPWGVGRGAWGVGERME